MTDPITEMGLVAPEDIAQMVRVDLSQVRAWIDDPTFPKPVAESPTGNIYHRREVFQWLLERHEKGMGIPIVPAP